LKLAFLLYKYFPHGGLQRDFLRIAGECQTRGHEIRAYVMEWRGERPAGFEIIEVPKRGWSSQARYRHYTNWVEKHIAQNPVELVIGFNKMPGLDVYYVADGCYESRVSELYGRIYRLGGRYRHFSAYEKAVFGEQSKTELLMISDVQKPLYQQYYNTQESRIHMLPPGIARDRCAPANAAEIRAEFRKEFAIADDEHVLLMVGSGFKTKGLDRALRAVASLPGEIRSKVQLFAIGEDNPAFFVNMAKRLGLDGQLSVFKGRDDIPRFMQGADLLLHPAYHENTGTVLLEAVVSGLPVLVSGICGYAHYVAEAGAGCVLDRPFNQEACNQKLHEMLVSDKRGQWKANGLAFAGEADIYSMPRHAADLIEVIGTNKNAAVSC
jgi:UDP-glucose:(heptosyl)LPS alpha-1,3-glucosyltransferase